MDEVHSTGPLAAPSVSASAGSAGSVQDTRTDEALMVGFRDGEGRAFDVLVLRHRRGLFNFLLRSVQNRSRAEEMLQEVFLRVVRSKERYEQTAKFTTWVYTIARNLCVDESRRAKFRRTVSLDAPRRGADGDDGPGMLESVAADQVATDDAAAAPQLRGRIAKAIELLPDDQREVFLMRQVSGLSFKEIGEIVGAPENTVKSRMRYALDKLRTELKDFADP
jgi:RNA polymerase sigma-70 factor (ECF subfamily)